MKTMARVLALLVLCCTCHAAYWGVAGDFADTDQDTTARLAPVLTQRGINSFLLNMRGRKRGPFLWTRTQKTFEDAHASVFWDAPSTLGECDRIHNLGEGPLTMSGEVLDRGSSLLSQRWSEEIQRTTAEMAMQLKHSAGFRIPTALDTSALTRDSDAATSWRRFLAGFFGDKSPADDTSGDTATFNASFGTNYQTWDRVPVSAGTDDVRRRRLSRMWIEKAHADYVNDICGALSPLDPKSLNGPAVVGGLSDTSDASLLASKKFVRCLYAGEADIPALSCAAATFGKPVLAGPVRLIPDDVSASRRKLLGFLPYVDGAFFDFQSVAALDSENQTIAFKPASSVISELAPFVGRLHPDRVKVLWVLPSDVSAEGVLDAYCISEDAFALDPSAVDLGKYQAVIYLNSSPCISVLVLQRLYDYAVKGGTVYLDAYRVGQGSTLHGRGNAMYWWQEDLEVKRADSGAGETVARIAGQSFAMPGTLPYLTGSADRLTQVGEVTDSAGAKYPLLYIRKLGKAGKWVFINVPDIRTQFALLRAIVRDQSQIALPSDSAPRLYTGQNCALAIGGAEPGGVTIPCSYSQAAVFDVASLTTSTLKPEGTALAPIPVGPQEAKLFVIKPYGKPVVLYADGVAEWAASIDDGAFDGKTLKFRFARRAFISSPSAPRSATIEGQDVSVDYDSDLRLLKITRRAGDPVEAVLAYD
jgi:hypothetical protein